MKNWHFYLKTLMIVVLATTVHFHLLAEGDWEAAYEKELKESGYTAKEIADIIKAEKEKRAKAAQAKASSKKTSDSKAEKTTTQTSSKKLTREEEKAELEKIEAQWEELLQEEYELQGRDLKEVLKYEMDVQKKLIKLTEDQKLEKEEELHLEAALKRLTSLRIVTTTNLGKKRSKRYEEFLSKSWEEWFYLSKSSLKEHITSVVDDCKALEIESRQERAKKTRDATIKEISATTGIFQRGGRGRGGRGGGNGWPGRVGELLESKVAKLCRVYWDKLIVNLTEKEYKSAKKDATKYLKKNGVSKDTLKTFFKALDPFIDDDYEEKIDFKSIGEGEDDQDEDDDDEGDF